MEYYQIYYLKTNGENNPIEKKIVFQSISNERAEEKLIEYEKRNTHFFIKEKVKKVKKVKDKEE